MNAPTFLPDASVVDNSMEFPEPLRRKEKPVEKVLDAREALRSRLVGEEPEPEPAPKPKKPKKPRDDDDDESQVDPEEETTPKEAPLTAEKIAEAAATGATKALLAHQKEEEDMAEAPSADAPGKATVEDETPKLPERYQEELPIYEELARINPKRYGGIVDQLIQANANEQAYIEGWQAQNPGEDYDAEDEQHKEFYDKAELRVDPEHWEKAKTQALKREVKEEITNQVRGEAQQAQAQAQAMERFNQTIPKVEHATKLAAIEIARAIAPDLPIDTKDLEKAGADISEGDPFLEEAILERKDALVSKLAAMEFLSSGMAKFDPQNAVHKACAEAVEEADKEIREGPASGRVIERNGQKVKYVSPEAFRNLNAQQRASHWTVSWEQARAKMLDAERAVVQKRYEKLTTMAEKRNATRQPKRGVAAVPTRTSPLKPRYVDEEQPTDESVSTMSGNGGGSGPVVGQRPAKGQKAGDGFSMLGRALGLE